MDQLNMKTMRGFSLIELLLGLVLGLFLMLGMVTLFTSVNVVYNEGQEMARLQENARFAMEMIARDVRMGSHRYCTSSMEKSGNPPTSGMPMVMVAAAIEGVPSDGSVAGIPALPNTSGAPYRLNNDYFVKGHDCDMTDGTCVPAVDASTVVPADTGTDDGDRAWGTDVLTLRYFAGGGVVLAADMASEAADVPVPGTLPNGTAVSFSAGDVVAVADCDDADIFQITGVSGTGPILLSHNDPQNVGGSSPPEFSKRYLQSEDARVFEINSITYYVAFREDAVTGERYSTLRRVENGNDQEMVPGVDRLDFLFGIYRDSEAACGGAIGQRCVSYLTAEEVEAQSVGECGSVGCLWRRVASVQIDVLMTSMNPMGSLLNEPYVYQGTELTPPAGIPRCQDGSEGDDCDDTGDFMMRRWFRSVISFRNMNA